MQTLSITTIGNRGLSRIDKGYLVMPFIVKHNERLMNKTLLTIAILGLLTLFSSAYYSAPADSRIGYKAPGLVLDNNNGLSPLQQHMGENVLLTFWSSADVESRWINKHYDSLSRVDGAGFVHVSVNMDRSEGVFDAEVAIDNLNHSTQFSTSQEAQEKIIKSWRLDEGYHSFLMDANGKIVAVDPDEQMLASLK